VGLPALTAALMAALVAVAALALVLRRVVVQGESMRPALAPGDRLLVVRVPPWVQLAPGAVVAAPDPRDRRRLLVKRVAAVEPGGRVVLHGDNPGASTDSRTFGPLARRAVWGVAWYRYAPPERAGRLRPLGASGPENGERRGHGSVRPPVNGRTLRSDQGLPWASEGDS
jgi:nickel-type superoxide dismutase maturation protease